MDPENRFDNAFISQAQSSSSSSNIVINLTDLYKTINSTMTSLANLYGDLATADTKFQKKLQNIV